MRKFDKKMKRRLGALIVLGTLVFTGISATLSAQSWGTTVQENASYRISIDDDDNATDEVFAVWHDRQDPGGGEELFRVQENGNVGIGTTSPGAKLHVSNGEILLDNNQCLLGKDAAGTGRNLIKVDNTNDVWVSGTNLADVRFYTGNVTIAMIIKENTGNVGIGTTTPSTPLAIRGPSGQSDVGITQNQLGNSRSMELTTADGSDNQATRIMIRGYQDNADIEFYTGSRGSETETMRIEGDNGNVGIGTTSPSTTLHVDGDVAFGEGLELTISSGVVTVTHTYHTIDTERDDPSDDLWTINGGDVAGQILIIRAANSGRTVRVKDDTGTGNIKLSSDFDLDNSEDTLTLIYDGSNWLELSRSDNGI